jgi:isoquinoline 1-oxidoreductase beta subunit
MQKEITRRNFLKTGSLVIAGTALVGDFLFLNVSEVTGATDQNFKPHAFVEIATDDTVTIWVGQSELGQGSQTGLAMVIADELDADWNNVQVKMALAADAFKDPLWHVQVTGGSSSFRNRWDLIRGAGAVARKMLIEAAASRWKIDPAQCKAISGKVIHPGGKSLSYGELVADARKLKVPENVQPKDPENYKIMGSDKARLDIPDKVSGRAVFGLDMQLPDMLIAVVARPAYFGATPDSYDEKAAMAVKHVKRVIKFDNKVAVCAENTYAALQGMEKLAIKWSTGSMPDLNNAKVYEILKDHLDNKCKVAHTVGDSKTALAKAAIQLDATYTFPYIAHAALEPINATAHVEKDLCSVWVPTQGQTAAQMAAMKITGLPQEKVEIHTTFVGGGFGLKSQPDPVIDAVVLSKMTGRPVKVMWTREEDFANDYFRPGSLHEIKGGIDKNGKPLVWHHKVACDSVMMNLMPAAVKDEIDHSSFQGIPDMPYEFENQQVEYAYTKLPIPVGFWRSVGYSFNVFTVETFFDEMAHAAGKDPLQFRLDHMKKETRAHSALTLLAEKTRAHGQPPSNHSRGYAVTECFEGAAACMAEVTVDRNNGNVKVHKIVTAVDCGTAVYPDQIKAQAEGGAVMATSVAFGEEIIFENGGVKTRNYDEYALLRMSDIPETVEVHIADKKSKAGGVGEPVFPAVAPAIANAIFQATGVRLRELPFNTKLLIKT